MSFLLVMLSSLVAASADASAPSTNPAASTEVNDGAGVREPPRPTHRVVPHYPRYLPVRVEEIACDFTMQVDTAGRVTDVDASSCYGALGEPLAEAFWKWRFDPATLDGVAVDGSYPLHLKLRLGSAPGSLLTADQFRTVYLAHSVLPGDGPGCGAALTVHADGSISDLAATRFPSCMIFLNAPQVDASAFQQGGATCAVHFNALNGHARRLAFEGCSDAAQAAISGMAEEWLFSSLGDNRMDWDLAVTFAGSDAG